MRIVSGGQTGVDRAALDAALAAGLPCGGFCPARRTAEDGTIPAYYPLTETESADPAVRTHANVMDADATLIVVRDSSPEVWGPGTRLTETLAREAGKPCQVIVLAGDVVPDELLSWLARNKVGALNIAGPRESECPGIYAEARVFLARVFSAPLLSQA